MAVQADDPADQILPEAVHHRHDDDQRGDAERDAGQGEDGDDGDETLPLAGAQVAPGHHALEGTEHRTDAQPPLIRAMASSTESSTRSPVARRFSSTLPAAAPRGPMIACQG